MYKLIKRVLFYNLPTHNQTTAEAVLLLPTYFLWQQPITPDNCCTAWTAPADMSGKKKKQEKKTPTHTHFKGFKYMQPLSANWSRNRCRQNMLEDNSDNSDWNFQHLCLCYVVSCYIDILCTSVCSTSPFFIYLHFFFLHPHRVETQVSTEQMAGIIVEQCPGEGSWSSRKECQHLGVFMTSLYLLRHKCEVN